MPQDFKIRENKGKRREFLYALFLAFQLGFAIAVPIVIILGIGFYLDKKFQTFPLIFLISVIGALLFSVFEIYDLILPFLRRREKGKKCNKK